MIAKKPKLSNGGATTTTKANKFIAMGTAPPANGTAKRELRDVIIGFDRSLLERIDEKARQMGLNRTAFVVNAVAEKLIALERTQ
jgi:hypothetical protein